MALIFVLLAGLFVAISNLCMRKGIDNGGTAKGFIVFQMMTGFFCAILLDPVRAGDYSINSSIVCMGIVAGLFFAGLIYALGKALEKGPPGFTFSLLSSATVMPGLAMAIFFGSQMGYPYTPWHAMGSLLVIGGLAWAGKGMEGLKDLKGWVLFSLSMFFCHVLLLVLFQYRALLLNVLKPEEINHFFNHETIRSQWFVPIMFLTSGLIQIGIYLKNEKRVPNRLEALFGMAGGILNCVGTFCLIRSTVAASALENAVIFPIYSVAIIVFSNLWGQKLYQEKVNWRACQVCACGLILGTVDWKGVAAAIGF
jgi:hypothetical protein